VHGGGLGEADEQHPRELWISQAFEQLRHFRRDGGVGALHLAVVALGGVEEQQRVAGRGGVEHHDPLLLGVHGPRECAEDGDLLGAWGA